MYSKFCFSFYDFSEKLQNISLSPCLFATDLTGIITLYKNIVDNKKSTDRKKSTDSVKSTDSDKSTDHSNKSVGDLLGSENPQKD